MLSFSRLTRGHATRVPSDHRAAAASGGAALPAPTSGEGAALLKVATAVLRPGVVRRLRAIAPDESLSLLLGRGADVQSLAALDARTRRWVLGLIAAGVSFSCSVSALVSYNLRRLGPVTYPTWLAVVEPIAAGLLTFAVLQPRNLAWTADPDRRPNAEWRVLGAVLVFYVCAQLAPAAFESLRARYGGMPVLPDSALVPYAALGALLQLTAVAYAAVLELYLVIMAADRAAVSRRRQFSRLLTAQAFCRAAEHLGVTSSHARPSSSTPGVFSAAGVIAALASAAQHIEQEFADAAVKVSDPLKNEARAFGHTIGDSVRAIAVPLLSSTPDERALLAEQLDGWAAAVIAGAWHRVIDREVAQRSERLWPRWQRERRERLRWLAFATMLTAVGVLVWNVTRVPGIPLTQVLSVVTPLLVVLVAFTASLDLFKRRDK